MADINRIIGPRDSPEEPKKKKDLSRDAFAELMKEGKVKEVDPEQKKLAKQQHEAEEEAAAAQMTQAADSGAKGTKEAKVGAAGTLSFKAAAAPPSQETNVREPPTPSEEPQPQEFFRPVPALFVNDSTQTIETKPASEPAPSEPSKKRRRKAEGLAPALPKPTPKLVAAPPKLQTPHQVPVKKVAEKTAAPPPPTKKEKPKEQVEQQIEGLAPPPLPQGGWESGQKALKKEEKKEEAPKGSLPIPLPPQTPEAPPLFMATLPPESSAPYLRLPPQLLEFFERIVGVLMVASSSGITKTSLTLDAPQFEGSPFFGSEIIITEFSTAPLSYNIEFLGSPQAKNLVQANVEELVAAFQAGQYNFKVNRIDVGLLPSPPVAKRKAEKVRRKKT